MARRNLKRVLGGLLVSAAFVGLLSLPLAARLAGVPPAEVENRPLAEAPPLQSEDVLEPNYLDGTWGTFLQDQLAFREWALHARALVSLHLFGESTSPRVLVGEEGFLFYDQEIDRGCTEKIAPAEQLVANARVWADYFRSKGGELLLVIVPDKAMVYRDKLTPGQLQRYACVDRKNEAVRAGLAAIESLALIDLYAELKAEAGRSPEPIYFRTDTHWKWRHSLTMVERILEHLKPGLFDPADIVPIDSQAQTDLALMLGLSKRVTVTEFEAERPGVELDVVFPSDSVPRVARGRGPPGTDFAEPAIFLADSFFNRSRAALEPYMAELVHLRLEEIQSPDAAAAIRRSRSFIVEVAMRNVYELFTEGLTPETLERVTARQEALQP
ncbi:MAG: hypothetical protein WD341_16835 [Tistlia sp.]|uniref:alginate O-acetyltransferase AlgX-related protein n=1 Tax=Tistlia sp. TaxID=3057121 RepID=UPI0034A5B76E